MALYFVALSDIFPFFHFFNFWVSKFASLTFRAFYKCYAFMAMCMWRGWLWSTALYPVSLSAIFHWSTALYPIALSAIFHPQTAI